MAVLVLGMWASDTSHAQNEQPNQVSVVVEAPAQVRAGEVITLRLRQQDNSAIGGAIGGFEARLVYARAAAEFAGFVPAPSMGDAPNWPISVPEMTEGSAIGFYACATTSCLNGRERLDQASASLAAESGILGEVTLLPLAEGLLEIRIDHLQLVDSAGQLLAVEVAQPGVVVQVGEDGTVHSAPASTWESATESEATAATAQRNITRDGTVTHGDVMEVAMAWQSAREDGSPCASPEADKETGADINGNGCLDIQDVQMVAAMAGNDGSQVNAAQVTSAMIFTVTSTLDEFDSDLSDGICAGASGLCTLRAAIQSANANPGSDTIVFAIPGGGVQTIQLSNRLPALSDMSGGTTIDGYSQPEAAPNSDPLVSNAQIRIQIRGAGYGGFDGLPITSAGNVVKGLSFFDLKRSLWIYGAGAYENVVVGNFVGTDASGTFAAASVSEEQAHGIHVEQGALGNRIGGATPAERNVVSGNARHGIGFWHTGTDENLVINNIVGLSPDGLRRIPNRQQGIDINFGASFNTVGGIEPGERNVISGNGVNGAEITHGESTSENVIRGNFIGTNVSGESAPAYASNGGVGISLHDRITNNLITQNVIVNNRSGGILLDSWDNCCTTNNRIENNWIGVTPGGTKIGNGVYGIHVYAPQTQIGPGNVIAYNPVGIRIEGDANQGNTITQNSIYSNTGLGIDIAPFGEVNMNDAGDSDNGPNEGINFPELQSASLTQVSGTACGGCRVEIFVADERVGEGYGEGMTFVGTGSANNEGAFTISIEHVEHGDFLTATATDVNGNTSEFSHNLLVAASSNEPPVAVDDEATTLQGEPVTVEVLANDSDADSDAITVVALGAASHGEVTTDGQTVVYAPVADFAGTDTFTYTVGDGKGGTSTAAVVVTVEEETGGTGSPGLTIQPREVTLMPGGLPVSYTIRLESEPTAEVTVKINAELPIVVAPQQVILTPQNWDVPQAVVVSMDSAAAVAQASAISHVIESADENYNGMDAPSLTVQIGENGAPGVFLPFITHE